MLGICPSFKIENDIEHYSLNDAKYIFSIKIPTQIYARLVNTIQSLEIKYESMQKSTNMPKMYLSFEVFVLTGKLDFGQGIYFP